MTKAVLVVGALSLLATADAFVPTCSRVAVPLTSSPTCAARASTSPILNLGSSPLIQRVGARNAACTARTELFSTPAASDGQVSPPAVTAVVPVEKDAKAPAGTVKVAAYFGLWYIFNIGYNIYNKRLLNVLPLPWMVASAQLGIGLFYVLPLWATKIRKAPKLAKGALGPLRSVVFYDTAVHTYSSSRSSSILLLTVAVQDRGSQSNPCCQAAVRSSAGQAYSHACACGCGGLSGFAYSCCVGLRHPYQYLQNYHVS